MFPMISRFFHPVMLFETPGGTAAGGTGGTGDAAGGESGQAGTQQTTETGTQQTTETAGASDAWTPPTKAEYDNLQRQAREAQTLRTEKETTERKRLEEAGEHKTIAEREKARADAAEARATTLEQSQRVERIATRLKFRDPTDVLSQLTDDERGDDTKAETKLKAIATAKPYLINDGEIPKTKDVTGDTNTAGDTSNQFGPSRMAGAYKTPT